MDLLVYQEIGPLPKLCTVWTYFEPCKLEFLRLEQVKPSRKNTLQDRSQGKGFPLHLKVPFTFP